MKKALLLTVMLSSTVFAEGFSYEGETAPEKWGDLKPEYALCKTGKYQTPIEINDPDAIEAKEHRAVKFNYTGNATNIINTGTTLQINFKDDSFIEFENKKYQLSKMEFHAPTEFTFRGGKRFAMEAQLFHKAEDGQDLVIGLMFGRSEKEEDPVIADIWKDMPEKKGEVKDLAKVDLNALVADFNAYYRINGSLTTPPCTEGVLWIITTGHRHASAAQIDKFSSIFGKNIRPVQDANGRVVIISK